MTALFLFPIFVAANLYLPHTLSSGLTSPRGIASSPTGPFWINDQATGQSIVYGGTPVAVPFHPTGIVYNGTPGFALTTGQPATFLFCTEDGTISGWNAAVDAKNAVVQIDHSTSGAVYKGIAIASNGAGPALYAANFGAGVIEVYDANFHPFPAAGGFQDPAIPAGYAPFNIQAFGNKLFVTFAMQDAAKKADVPGPGNGYVDVFDVNGSLVQRVAAGAVLNSPWGLAIAPSGFGDFAGALLVGNSGDGKINGFNMNTGGLLGALQDVNGTDISIPGLFGLIAGNGGTGGDASAIYFAARGMFGSLQAAPSIGTNGIVNGASFQLGIAPYTFVSILGTNLSATTREWQGSDFVNGQLPVQLDGVSVTVDGAPAFPVYISPRQLNVLMPTRVLSGFTQVTSNGLASSVMPAQVTSVAPAFFISGTNGYAAATHAIGTPVTATTPARPGETISFYGTGFGPTAPPVANGAIVTTSLALAAQVSISIGGINAQVLFAGISATGLYQFNVVVPDMPAGDVPVVAQISGVATPTAVLPVVN